MKYEMCLRKVSMGFLLLNSLLFLNSHVVYKEY